MILDRGFCTIYRVDNVATGGAMPVLSLVEMRHQSWYGELNFETSPLRTSATQEDVEVSARVRVVQNRAISNQDVAVLSNELPPPANATQFEILRAYHGVDEENGQPITDLTLREVQAVYDIV